jgi:hypothetical protein
VNFGDIKIVPCEKIDLGVAFVIPTWTPDWDDADDVERWVYSFVRIAAERPISAGP